MNSISSTNEKKKKFEVMVRQRKHFNKWRDFECTTFIFNFFLDTSFDSNRLAANEFSDKIICKWFISYVSDLFSYHSIVSVIIFKRSNKFNQNHIMIYWFLKLISNLLFQTFYHYKHLINKNKTWLNCIGTRSGDYISFSILCILRNKD